MGCRACTLAKDTAGDRSSKANKGYANWKCGFFLLRMWIICSASVCVFVCFFLERDESLESLEMRDFVHKNVTRALKDVGSISAGNMLVN